MSRGFLVCLGIFSLVLSFVLPVHAQDSENRESAALKYLKAEFESLSHRLDTKTAKEIRFKIYKFLSGYLSPPHPFRSVKDLFRAGYRW